MTTKLEILSEHNEKIFADAGVKVAMFVLDNGFPLSKRFVTVEIGRAILRAMQEEGIVNGDEATDLDRQMVEADIANDVGAVIEKMLALDISAEVAKEGLSVERCPCKHTSHATVIDNGHRVTQWSNLAHALDQLCDRVVNGHLTVGQALHLLHQAKALDIAIDDNDESQRFEALDPEIKEALRYEAKQQNLMTMFFGDFFQQ